MSCLLPPWFRVGLTKSILMVLIRLGPWPGFIRCLAIYGTVFRSILVCIWTVVQLNRMSSFGLRTGRKVSRTVSLEAGNVGLSGATPGLWLPQDGAMSCRQASECGSEQSAFPPALVVLPACQGSFHAAASSNCTMRSMCF